MKKEALELKNRILLTLKPAEYRRVMSSAQHANLVSGDVLFEAGARISELYFINTGMASLLSTTTEGNTIEVGMVGHEGLVGAALLLKNPQMPYRSVMQISGHVTKIPARPLVEEFNKNPDFRNVILRYLHFMLSQISQSAVCNRFHTIEERLCRWLMISREFVDSDELPLTQELLSEMLGVARTGVTMAAGALQQSGLIRYARGRIRIVDVQALADASCECYQIVKHGFDMFLKDTPVVSNHSSV